MTALYLERYMNFGLSLQELQSGRPIVGISQTGSDLVAVQSPSPGPRCAAARRYSRCREDCH